jgi:hypothetical protein
MKTKLFLLTFSTLKLPKGLMFQERLGQISPMEENFIPLPGVERIGLLDLVVMVI